YSEMWQSIVPQVIQGNIESIKKIVEDHKNGLQVMASLRSRCIDGSTLLHVAAYYGEAELVETLLHLQLDVDILDYRGATALQRSRDVKIMQLLLKHGADVKWSDDDGNTALHMVCFGEPGKPSKIDCLLFLHNLRVLNSAPLVPSFLAASRQPPFPQTLANSQTKEHQ
ncbi:ankyrin repeat-containing YCR051W-like, partial [Pelobates cultripes]